MKKRSKPKPRRSRLAVVAIDRKKKEVTAAPPEYLRKMGQKLVARSPRGPVVGVHPRHVALVPRPTPLRDPDCYPRLQSRDLWQEQGHSMKSAPSLRTIAKMTGLHYSYLSLIFSRKRYPSMKSSRKIAAVFGITLDRFWEFLEVDYTVGPRRHGRKSATKAQTVEATEREKGVLRGLGIRPEPPDPTPYEEPTA